MLLRQVYIWMKRMELRHGNNCLIANRMISTIIYTVLFTIVAIFMKKIIWELYLLAPHAPEEAWMDPREQRLIVTHLLEYNKTER